MTTPSRHQKMVSAATWLAENGAFISWGATSDGKAVKRHWKNDMTRDRVEIEQALHGARNALVIPAGRLIVIDVDGHGWYERLKARGLPPTFTVVTPTLRNVLTSKPVTNGDDRAQTYHGRQVYGLAPEGYDVEQIPSTWAGGETRRSLVGDQNMVLGPWALRSDGIYVPEEGTPRTLAVIPAEVLDWLAAHPADGEGGGIEKPPKTGDWLWADKSYGARHDHMLERTRFWRGTGVTGDALRQTALDYIERHQIPREPRAGTNEPALSDGEIERMCKGAEDKFEEDPPPINLDLSEEPTVDPASVLAQMQAARVAVAQAVPNPDRDNQWLVRNLIRPGSLCVLASQEGVGKSTLRLEPAIRGAIGSGDLFGWAPFVIQKPFKTVLMDEENGEDEEADREEAALAALGVSRAALGDRYVRYSFAGVDLVSKVGRARIEAAVSIDHPDLLILDTATQMVGEEWGPDLKEAIRWLRGLIEAHGCAVLLVVHLVKPQRDRSGVRHTGSRTLSDVMGQWARPVDAVIVVSGASGEDRVHFDVYKRVPKARLLLSQSAGIWTAVAVVGDQPKISLPTGVPPSGLKILQAIADGIDPLDHTSVGMGRSYFFEVVGGLREKGLMARGQPFSLTPEGVEAVRSVRSDSVRFESGDSPLEEVGS